MAPANLLQMGVLPSICEALHNYKLCNYFESWFSNSVFPSYAQCKAIVKSKIKVFEENARNTFVLGVVMYYTPGHLCPGCVVHHYSYLWAL